MRETDLKFGKNGRARWDILIPQLLQSKPTFILNEISSWNKILIKRRGVEIGELSSLGPSVATQIGKSRWLCSGNAFMSALLQCWRGKDRKFLWKITSMKLFNEYKGKMKTAIFLCNLLHLQKIFVKSPLNYKKIEDTWSKNFNRKWIVEKAIYFQSPESETLFPFLPFFVSQYDLKSQSASVMFECSAWKGM